MDQKVFRVVLRIRASDRKETLELIKPMIELECCESFELTEDNGRGEQADTAEETPHVYEGRKGDIALYCNGDLEGAILCKIMFKQGDRYGIKPMTVGIRDESAPAYIVSADNLWEV